MLDFLSKAMPPLLSALKSNSSVNKNYTSDLDKCQEIYNERVLKKEKAPIKYDDSQYFEENAIKLSDSKHMHTDLENTYDFII